MKSAGLKDKEVVMQRLGFGLCVVIAFSVGALVQYTWAACGGPFQNSTCSPNFTVSCPANEICQYPNHGCGINVYHKGLDFGKEYKRCVSAPPGNTCENSINGCRFEEWTTGCGAATGVILKPCCYGECGTPL